MAEPANISFVKMNGLGNQIVVLDLRDQSLALSEDVVRSIASSPRSGFDQIMVLHPPKTADTDAFVDIFNTDGSRSSACGNGTRCIGWYEAQKTGRDSLVFETHAGLLNVSVASIDAITVDMGEPRTAWHEIPVTEEFHDTTRIELQIGPIDAPVLHSPSVVNMGNPHAVFWVDDVNAHDLAGAGPLLEHHPIFPERANISLAQVVSRTAIKIRTWERGAGLTQACGTAACAAAVSAIRKELTEPCVTVTVPGGDLKIEWLPSNHVLMTGPIEVEYEDKISL